MGLRVSRSKKSLSITWMLLAVFAIVILQRITINSDASATGSFAASSAAYTVAISTMFLIISAFIFYSKGFIAISRNPTNVSIIIFYVYAAITSIASLLPLLSAFRAISGIGLVLAAAAYGRYLERRMGEAFEAQIFYLALGVLTAYSIGSAIFQSQVLGAPILPLRGGMGAVIAFYLVIWKFIDFFQSFKLKDVLLALLFFSIGFSLNSISSIIALFTAAILLNLVNGRYVIFAIGAAVMAAAVLGFIAYLEANIDSVVFNKPARSYLIGTGRFPLFEYAYDLYWDNTSFLRKLFGYGFMAEREVLRFSDLSWTISLHNSMFSNLLGTGLIGFSLALSFLASPVLAFNYVKKSAGASLAKKWMAAHLIFMVFGLTSSDYPNSPSWILLLFLAFNSGVYSLISRSKNEKGAP